MKGTGSERIKSKSTFKKWEGRSNDDRPVGSTTVSENLTIRLIRNEREFAFSAVFSIVFDSVLGLIQPSFCLFLLSLALSGSKQKSDDRSGVLRY